MKSLNKIIIQSHDSQIECLWRMTKKLAAEKERECKFLIPFHNILDEKSNYLFRNEIYRLKSGGIETKTVFLF